MPKPSNRDRILKAGLEVMYREGYGGAGVREIVAEALAKRAGTAEIPPADGNKPLLPRMPLPAHLRGRSAEE